VSVSLLEVSKAAQIRAVALTAETAGYLLLATIDAGGLQQRAVAAETLLLESGEIRLGRAQAGAVDCERELRALLEQLLALCSVAHLTLSEVSTADRRGTLTREIEAALIPVNRAAARRALARLCRETERARRAGKLDDLASAAAHLSGSISRSVALVEPSAKVQERGTAVPQRLPGPPISQKAASDDHRPRELPATADIFQGSTDPVEHTVRIDLAQLAARAAAPHPAGKERRANGRRLVDVRAPLELPSKTPFLGSVVTALREETSQRPEIATIQEQPAVLASAPPAELPHLEAAEISAGQVLAAEVAAQDLAEITIVDAPVVELAAELESSSAQLKDQEPSLSHTPAWQPNVQAMPRIEPGPSVEPFVAAPSSIPPRVAEPSEPSLAAEPGDPSLAGETGVEADSFFLLLDDAESSPVTSSFGSEEALQAEQQSEHELGSEEACAQAVEPAAGPATSSTPMYSPRKSELQELLAHFDRPAVDNQNVSQELKQMAGIEASASSQTPPPVGFSELDESSPLPDSTTKPQHSGNVLSRAKGVGLATLTGLSLFALLLRMPSAPSSSANAAGAAVQCAATIRVVDAPIAAEIRLRSPVPGSSFAPLAAHGSTATFGDLPCNVPVEVMVRDTASVDAAWLVIPIAREELSRETALFPLRVSALNQ